MTPEHKRYQQQLIHLGLSDKEALVYLALLSVGSGTVTEISQQAGIKRTTGYPIIDQLVAKGLATISGKEPTQEYVAEPPRKIALFLEKQAKTLAEKAAYADTFAHELSTVHNVAGRPKVRFYEGAEGIQEIYEDTLTADSKEGILAYAHVEDVHQTLPHYFPKYYQRRAANNIPIKAIFTDTPAARSIARHDKEEKRTSLFVDVNEYNFTPEINIYNNKVMIASWREKLGITIESHEIADAMKKIFKLAWIGAQSLNKWD